MKNLTFLVLLLVYTGLTMAQTCNTAIPADAPDNRYITNVNGTVLDKKTGLTWMRCALGQTWNGTSCTGTTWGYTWQRALQEAESTVFASLSDWRLPSVKELQSLTEGRCAYPAINSKVFPSTITDHGFWSSSPSAYYSDAAWVVYFWDSNDYEEYKNSPFAVRLVRGGQ